MLEKELEVKFKKRVESYGARVWKFVSPGKSGVPDRIVLIPGGRCVFAEIKKPGEHLRELQKYIGKKLQEDGFDVWTIDSEARIDRFCEFYFRN